MGSNTSLAPLYACSRRGERALAKTPRNWGSNLTLLASMSAEGMGSSLVVEGATTRGVFEAYLERVLAPSLWPGQVVVMDNLSSHKGGRVREIVERVGAASFSTCRPTHLTQSHRGGLRQAQSSPARDGGSEPRGSHRSDGRGTRWHEPQRRSRLLRALRLPYASPILMTYSLRSSRRRENVPTPGHSPHGRGPCFTERSRARCALPPREGCGWHRRTCRPQAPRVPPYPELPQE
jgi:hypothetical protein